MTELSVMLPACREGENLRTLLPALQAELQRLGVPYEILVIDTQTPADATPDLCAEHGARYLPREGGGSYGHAVRTGIAHARGEWLLCMDADGAHSPAYIPQLYAHRHEYDVVIASRYVAGGKTYDSARHVAMSRFLNAVSQTLLGLRVRDASTSYKLYRNSQLRALSLRCDHFDIQQEMLFRLARAHPDLRIREVPFSFEKRLYGESKRNYGVFLCSYLATLLKLRFTH